MSRGEASRCSLQSRSGCDRTLALPKRLAALLRQRQADQRTEQLAAGEQWRNSQPDGTQWLVFTTLKGTPLEPGPFTNAIKAALSAAGAGHLRGHDLRHSARAFFRRSGCRRWPRWKCLAARAPM
jgi:integrase